MTVALSTMGAVMCAGSRGPPRSQGGPQRESARSSPSPSSTCSNTIAPCSARNAASHPSGRRPRWRRTCPVRGLLDIARRVRAARDGDDDLGAHLVRHVEEPRELGIGVAEVWPPRRRRSAGTRRAACAPAKVLVSCIIIATTIFWRAIDGSLRVRPGGVGDERGAAADGGVPCRGQRARAHGRAAPRPMPTRTSEPRRGRAAHCADGGIVMALRRPHHRASARPSTSSAGKTDREPALAAAPSSRRSVRPR